MKLVKNGMIVLTTLLFFAATAFSAYHHEGEADANVFLQKYPAATGTKLDHCALCHRGGETGGDRSKTYGSCQWCHYKTDYGAVPGDANANVIATLNGFGLDYFNNGRNLAALEKIEGDDSDGDTESNLTEIAALTFPGDASDDSTKTPAPFRVYTKAQLLEMTQHTQFMLMNTSRSGDYYAKYSGVPMADLLDDAGILPEATEIFVYAPDGWETTHPRNDDGAGTLNESYHLYGAYPPATYYYHPEADTAINPTYGWCDYSSPSTRGRSPGDTIHVDGGLKAILALMCDDAPLEPGRLNDENKLDGSGPFRVVVPQKASGQPDQSSKADVKEVEWPHDSEGLDHNAGFCARSATIIKVGPLPDGMTDINVREAGWKYVDEEKIIIYGAIDGTDSNGNGILDSEEKTTGQNDFDGDGTEDYQDRDTASFKHPNGNENVLIWSSGGEFANVCGLKDTDVKLSQAGKPEHKEMPYGVLDFSITGLANGAEVTLTIVFPGKIPADAEFYKITASGWNPIPFILNPDVANSIIITLKDGDPATDSDGIENGTIVDPGALVTNISQSSSDSSGNSSCFISSLID